MKYTFTFPCSSPIIVTNKQENTISNELTATLPFPKSFVLVKQSLKIHYLMMSSRVSLL